jgi:Spy/CpxP family protein refolding chaperone
MNKKIITLGIIAFLLALGAGALLGVNIGRTVPPHGRHSWMAEELSLTPQQQGQMREIWSQAMQKTDPSFGERRHALLRERDEAIAELISPEQQAAYDKIIADYEIKKEALDQERSKTFQDAVERTKRILDDSQRRKYEEILKNDSHHHGSDDHRPGPATAR